MPGPDGAFICDECVEICAGIIEEEVYGDRNNVAEEEEINLLKPKEIKEFFGSVCYWSGCCKEGTFGSSV